MKVPHRRQFLQLVAGAASCPTIPARAQSYPTRPVTIVDASAAGGTSDASARIVGQHMSRTLGQQFLVENVPGAVALLAQQG